jgi:hypothetical protein
MYSIDIAYLFSLQSQIVSDGVADFQGGQVLAPKTLKSPARGQIRRRARPGPIGVTGSRRLLRPRFVLGEVHGLTAPRQEHQAPPHHA